MAETELYRHFDAQGQLLYVGISMTTLKRAGEHRRTSGWWSQVASITIERFETRAAALAAELHAIQTEQPLHNRQGKGRRKGPLPTVYLPIASSGERLRAYFRERGLLKHEAV